MEGKDEKEKVWHHCQCGAKYSQPQSLKRHQENGGCHKKRKLMAPEPQTSASEPVTVLEEEKSQEYRSIISDLQCCEFVK